MKFTGANIKDGKRRGGYTPDPLRLVTLAQGRLSFPPLRERGDFGMTSEIGKRRGEWAELRFMARASQHGKLVRCPILDQA